MADLLTDIDMIFFLRCWYFKQNTGETRYFYQNPDNINQTEKRKKLIKSVSEVTGETQFTAEIMKVFADSQRLQ